MIGISSVKIDDKDCLGLKVDLPESPPMVMIIGGKGFVMCGLLNVETAEKLGVAAAMVSGVKNIEEALNAQVKATTSKARSLGVELGMKGADALRRMC